MRTLIIITKSYLLLVLEHGKTIASMSVFNRISNYINNKYTVIRAKDCVLSVYSNNIK